MNVQLKSTAQDDWNASISLKKVGNTKPKQVAPIQPASPHLLQEINQKLYLFKVEYKLDFNRLARLLGWSSGLKEVLSPKRNVSIHKVQALAEALGIDVIRLGETLTHEELEAIRVTICNKDLHLQKLPWSNNTK